MVYLKPLHRLRRFHSPERRGEVLQSRVFILLSVRNFISYGECMRRQTCVSTAVACEAGVSSIEIYLKFLSRISIRCCLIKKRSVHHVTKKTLPHRSDRFCVRLGHGLCGFGVRVSCQLKIGQVPHLDLPHDKTPQRGALYPLQQRGGM